MKNELDNINTDVKDAKKNKGYKPKWMSKKQIEEAVCWILQDREYASFSDKMKPVMNELRGKADHRLIRTVVENYHF